MGTCAARASWAMRTSRHTAQGNGQVIFCFGTMTLCAKTLAVLLVIGGVEKNPGPGVEAEIFMQVLCSWCDGTLKSGTQCDICGRWFHNSCGNFKAQVVENGKCICEKCRLERLRMLEEKLQNALLHTEETNKEEQSTGRSYDWQQLEGKLAEGGIWWWVILKVLSAG